MSDTGLIEIFLEFRDFSCESCNTLTSLPSDEGMAAAHHLLRSETSGHLVAFLSTRKSGLVAELEALLDESPEYLRLPVYGRPVARGFLISQAVDRDDDGSRFWPRAAPRCPNCGDNLGAGGGQLGADPPKGRRVLVRQATFKVWDALSAGERGALRDEALDDFKHA